MRSDHEIPEWLHRAIREEAERHQPDRAHMYARVEAAMPSAFGRSNRLRMAGSALAAAVAVAVTTIAVWQGFAARGPTSARPPAAGPDPTFSAARVSAAPSGAASPMATGGSPVPAAKETGAVRSLPSGTDHFLRSTGTLDPTSNEYWTQESLTLITGRRLSALRVTVRVARNRGVASTGSWLTLPTNDFTVTVREKDSVLSYQFVLRRGRTVPRGKWIFAVQYNHAQGGRDGRFDTYVVTATTVGGTDGRVRGHY